MDKNKNSLGITALEEELELLLKQNLPSSNKKTKNAPPYVPAPPINAEATSLDEARQTLEELAKQAEVETPPIEKTQQSTPKPSVKLNKAPKIDSVNLNDLYIEPTQLNYTPDKAEETSEAVEEFEEIASIEPPLEDEPFLEQKEEEFELTKGLQDFLNEPEEEIIPDDIITSEDNLIPPSVAAPAKTSLFNNWQLLAFGFLSLLSAFSYYVYVYQPYAPSLIYADKSPYKTKNMVENLQEPTIVDSATLINKQAEEQKNNESITIKQPFIKPIENNKEQSASPAPAKIEAAPKVKPEAKTKEPEVKIDKEIKKTPTTIVKDEKKIAPIDDKAPAKEVKPIKTEPKPVPAPKLAAPEIAKIEHNTFTEQDQEFDTTIEPKITDILTPLDSEKPVAKKITVIKNTVTTKKLDPWEANQLKKNMHGSFFVQLASLPILEQAQTLEKTYAKRYSSALQNKSITIVKSNLIHNHIYYRLRVKTNSLAQAHDICSAIRDSGGECIFGKN